MSPCGTVEQGDIEVNKTVLFLDLEGGSQKATLVILLVVVGISSPGSKSP